MTDFRSVDPCTGRLLAERPTATADQVDAAATIGADAAAEWAETPLSERTDALRRVAATLRARAPQLGALATSEMGKPLGQAKAEVEKCAWACEHAAAKAEEWLAFEPVPTEARRSGVRHDPLGLVLAIMPWNFPFWQVFRFGASALAAGNAVLVKHAPNVPQCAEAIAGVAADSGLPDGLVQNVFAPVDAVAGLIAHPRVAGVTLTGSPRAGRAVAELAGRHLKPSVLELGGSDPFLVLADADVDAAADLAAKARLQNNGQSCIAAKRFLVEAAVADRFVEAFRARLAAAVLGDPVDPATTLGPLARRDLRDQLHDQVRASVGAGARCLLGGEVPARDGWWYPATLLTGCAPGMPAWSEETFGPVAAVRVVRDAEQALADANASAFGLGAAICTADPERAERLAAKLRCGSVFVNDFVRSDPRLPVGGLGESGWGRELGREGMRAFTVTKSVWLA